MSPHPEDDVSTPPQEDSTFLSRVVPEDWGQCSFHDAHDEVNDVPSGNRCQEDATHEIHWADGRVSAGCAEHLVFEGEQPVLVVEL